MSQKGLASASIKEIAGQAEINPGLVHYHFKNKEEVLAAVVQKVAQDIGTEWAKLQQANKGDPDFMESAFVRLEGRIRADEAVYRARFELYVAAMNAPALRPGLQAMIKEIVLGMARSFELSGFECEDQNRQLADILYACLDSFAMRHIIDPEFDLSDAMSTLARVLKAVK